MQYQKLGATGIEVSTVAMGCWAIVGDSTWGPQDETEAIAAIRTALEVGITLFDSAEGYGDGASEALLGRGLGADRNRAVIATKVSGAHLKPDQVRIACDRSLRHLKTDTIDLYQIHWPNPDVPLADTLGAMEALRLQGKIRAIGVSNFGSRSLDELAKQTVKCASNQLVYSLLARAIEFEIQPKCIEQNLSILPYSPLAQGLLTGKFKSADEVPAGRARTRHFSSARPGTRHHEPGCEAETFAAITTVRDIAAELGRSMSEVALAWLLHQQGVTSVLAGARNPDQVKLNAAAAELTLSPQIVEQLSDATRPVKDRLGANADMWVTEAEARIS